MHYMGELCRSCCPTPTSRTRTSSRTSSGSTGRAATSPSCPLFQSFSRYSAKSDPDQNGFAHHPDLGSFAHHPDLGSFTHYPDLVNFAHYPDSGSIKCYLEQGCFEHFSDQSGFAQDPDQDCSRLDLLWYTVLKDRNFILYIKEHSNKLAYCLFYI